MREVPYFTTDDETKPCGHIWKERQRMGGPWGFAWKVLMPGSEEGVACGWQPTQAGAEMEMQEALAREAAKLINDN